MKGCDFWVQLLHACCPHTTGSNRGRLPDRGWNLALISSAGCPACPENFDPVALSVQTCVYFSMARSLQQRVAGFHVGRSLISECSEVKWHLHRASGAAELLPF